MPSPRAVAWTTPSTAPSMPRQATAVHRAATRWNARAHSARRPVIPASRAEPRTHPRPEPGAATAAAARPRQNPKDTFPHMSQYTAPLDDIRFILDDVLDAQSQFARLGYTDATPDVVDAVLDEAARFAGSVLAPLNAVGDQQGCRHDPATGDV